MNDHYQHDDDRPVGRILSRREALALLGGAGATIFLAACGDVTNTATTAATTSAAGATTAPAVAASSTAAATTTAAGATAAGNTVPTTAAGTTAAATTSSKEDGSVVASTTTASTTVAQVAAGGCVVRPEVTEGPYFKDDKINRSDIRSDTSTGTVKAGVPITLSFMVSQVNNTCAPLKGAQVDVWHCDAVGTYSDTTDPNWGSTVGQNYLRGYQLTDATGKATFTTIYPGWYSGRTIHIHFKIRTTGADGQAYEFTSQLFFDESMSDTVLAQAPYNTKKGTRNTKNANDNIYQSAGTQMILGLSQSGSGYTGSFAVGLDLTDTSVGKSDSAGGAGGPGGGMPPGGPGGTPRAGGRPGGPPNGTPPGGMPGGTPPTTQTPTS